MKSGAATGRGRRTPPRRTRGLPWATVLAATWWVSGLAAGAAWAQAPPAPQGGGATPESEEPPRIRTLTFEGLEQASRRGVSGVMRLSGRSWWNPLRKNYFYGLDYLDFDLQRILDYLRWEGFLLARIVDASVDYPSRDRVDLTIRIEEGPRFYVRGWRIEGVTGDLLRRMKGKVEVRPRMPAREVVLQGDRLELAQVCGDRGYALAQVRRELHLEGDSTDVVYGVELGPLVRVGKVTARGQVRTAPDVILREVSLRPGDLLRLNRSERSQDRLFDLGVFRSVQIIPRYGGAQPESTAAGEVTVDLDVEVQEKPPGWFGTGFGYSSRDRLRVSGEWGYRNLGGRARRVQATGEIAYSLLEDPGQRFKRPSEWQVEFSYDAPWMLGTPTRWELRTYVLQQRFFQQTAAATQEDVFGVALRGRWDLTRFRWLLGSIENKWTTQDSSFVTRFLSLSVAEDRRDFVLDPGRGHLFQVGAEYAGGILGGQADFTRWTLGLTGYAPMAGGFVWARRLRAGYIQPYHVRHGEGAFASVPIGERFFAGGGTSVRGYQDESLGPRVDGQSQGGLVLLLLNTELRFPLFWRLGGVAFLDAGNVWADYKQLTWSRFTGSWTDSDFSDLDVAWGVGTGLRFHTPVGPVRLDYAVKVGQGYRSVSGRDAEWHLNLGQAF
jgi:outer membrane protein insertion porin family